jgi:hypothetical protein
MCIFFGKSFTDRGHGQGFVLSEHRAASRAGEGEHIKAYRVYTAGIRRVEGKLLGMCQNIVHVYKQIVNWVQMYNINLFNSTNFLLTYRPFLTLK